MPKGTDAGNHPARRVGRDRFDTAIYTTMNRYGGSFDTGQGPRPAFTLRENREFGSGAVISGGPAGKVTMRGPSWSRPKTTRFSGAD